MDRQSSLPFGARDTERFQLLNNLQLLGRSTSSGRVRALVELVGRVCGDEELTWTIEQLCDRLNETERTMRRTIQEAENCGALLVRRCRRQDRSLDRLALRVNWPRLAARDLVPLIRSSDSDSDVDQDAECDVDTVRPSWPDGPAKLAAPVRPSWPDGPAKLAGQYMLDKQIPPPPPTPTATATASAPRRDTGHVGEPQPGGTSWAAAAEVLRGTGFASWRRLIVDCQKLGKTPDELIEACETYTANQSKFAGPGAIAAWVRNGDWPVNGVQAPDAARVRLVTVERERQDRDLESWAFRVIADGRRRGLGRTEIAAVLQRRGYVWS